MTVTYLKLGVDTKVTGEDYKVTVIDLRCLFNFTSDSDIFKKNQCDRMTVCESYWLLNDSDRLEWINV